MSEYKSQLMDRMRSEDLKNVTFIVEGEEIKVNKTLIAASCPYFNTMLFGDTEQSKQSTITLDATPNVAFKTIINFIYTDECKICCLTAKQLFELISLIHDYQFDHLSKNVLQKVDFSNYSIDDAINFYHYFRENGLDDWREACLRFCDNIFQYEYEFQVATDIILKFPKQMLLELTARNTFTIREVDLFRYLNSWKENNADVECTDLFTNLRLNLIKREDFSKYVLPTKLIKSEDYLIAYQKDEFPQRFTICKTALCKTVIPSMNTESDTVMLNKDCFFTFYMGKCEMLVSFVLFEVSHQTHESNFIVEAEDNNNEPLSLTKPYLNNRCSYCNRNYDRHEMHTDYFDEYKVTVSHSPSTVSTFRITSRMSNLKLRYQIVCFP
ncbi:uncharacterized protein B4U80_13310 [Leptotrombidium deliense]|uniref:BTB domain-containing protein n=1 Tax=Leptotrombidium deliense TaxID=299467 RepID=A0A443S8I8_9ACAR|nr:uncharacterized protein B4U80_13310 [Leptotrombidium deliense]